MGLGHLYRHVRTVPEPAVPVHSIPADDLNLRNAHDAAASRSGGGAEVNVRNPIYGLMAEFDSPTVLVAAVRPAREAGYRKTDAYLPISIEELSEGMHRKDRFPHPV